MSVYRSVAISCVLASIATLSAAQESFRVELGRDGETIGDMRPVFLEFKTQPMPAISPVEVARRYRKLFDSSGEPEVRIDALARLSNIQRFTDQDVSISQEDEQRIYREAIDSYDAVINRGSYHGKLDELLYQMAKAHAFIGQVDASTDRLKQLVGLYPSSELVPEARFRIAEASFSAGDYEAAEVEYTRLISGEGGNALKTKARYMLGWSQYKQGPVAWGRAAKSFLTVLDGLSQTTDGFQKVAKADANLVEDTFRIVALMAAEADGVRSVTTWAQNTRGVNHLDSFSELLFDRLADLYATRAEYERSVAVSLAFIEKRPEHPIVPAFFAQAIDVWQMAGRPDKVWSARADFVAAFSSESRFTAMASDDQAEWRNVARKLADYHYDRGESASGSEREQRFAEAAGYYAQLAERENQPGETLRLAGDASLQANRHARALDFYEQAAFQAAGYEAAADSGWAALLIERDAVDGKIDLPGSLGDLAASVDKWTSAFPDDRRIPQISLDIANRLLRDREYERAARFAGVALAHPAASQTEIYGSLLVVGENHVANQSFGLAENTWRKALALANSSEVSDATDEDIAAIRKQLATSIYDQGRTASDSGKIDIAVAHFQRIDSVLPGSEIAIKGRFDAANTLLVGERWLSAINELSRFRQDFPTNELTKTISEKLVYAYISAEKPERAADELMNSSAPQGGAFDQELRAARLYHEAGALQKRNDIYIAYLDQANEKLTPETAAAHVEIQTIRHRLIESGISENRYREELIASELASQWHSDETLLWSGQAAIYLGEIQANRFSAVELRAPLATSLEKKRRFMESARQRYTQAEQLGGEALVSQTTFRRAELFRAMAQALMSSEPPAELNEMEAMQYQMLLEEEAFPFEEKAIVLHEQNHQRVTDIGLDPWVEKSLQVLARLHPGRYDRAVRWMSWNEGVSDGA